MEFNRIYFFLKDDLNGDLTDIQITPQVDNKVISNILSIVVIC